MVNLRLTLEFAVLSWVIETAAGFGASYDELRSGAVKSCQAKWSDAFIQRVFSERERSQSLDRKVRL
jgi:hypothetical protein